MKIIFNLPDIEGSKSNYNKPYYYIYIISYPYPRFKSKYDVNTIDKEVNHLITFIKNHNLVNIRKKLIILYILNITDIIFTLALLQTGMFKEINIFMVNAVESPLISILLKVVLPAILLIYLYKRIALSDNSQLRVANIGLLVSLTLYSLVNLSHIIWVALLPVFRQMI